MKTIQSTFLLCIFSIALSAQDPGDLNMAFGQDGIFSVAWEDLLCTTDDIGVLSEGSLIVAGNYIHEDSSNVKITVFKITNQGDPVPFGHDAHGFEYDISIFNSVEALCVLPGDKIVIAVGTDWMLETPHLVMLTADGDPEMSFGEDGVFTYPQTMYVNDINFFQHDGEVYIIMCGGDEDNQPVLLMINQYGEPVSSFGNAGMYTLTSVNGTFSDLVIDRETNQMYLSGIGSSSSDCNAFLAKYELPGGYRNSDFGEDGILCFTEESGFNGTINSIVYEGRSHTLTAFGFILQEESTDIFAYRVNAEDGSADNTFGINGWSALIVSGTYDRVSSAVVQPDGKYLFGGHTNFSGNRDFMIGRLTTGGLLDLSFGNNGLKISEIYSEKSNSIKAIILSPDCDILYAAGVTDTPDNSTIAVAAYHTGYEPETGLGIGEQVSGPVKISPNPVKNLIRIHTGQTGFHQVRIIDVTGKEVFHQNHQGESATLNLGFLPAALYFVQITLPDHQVGTYKLLKQ